MKRTQILSIAVVAASSSLGASAASAAPMPVQHVRGTISDVHGSSITVATANGPMHVMLGAKTRVAAVVPASISDIKTGTFIGSANVPGHGSAARALEVVVFPASMNGTGEGDYPWDLKASGGSSSMTNGTVAAPKTSMTNATVSRESGGSIKTVTLTYQGGSKTLTISPDIPIVRVMPGSRSLIVKGAHVVVTPPLDAAKSVVVGEHGAVPPM